MEEWNQHLQTQTADTLSPALRVPEISAPRLGGSVDLQLNLPVRRVELVEQEPVQRPAPTRPAPRPTPPPPPELTARDSADLYLGELPPAAINWELEGKDELGFDPDAFSSSAAELLHTTANSLVVDSLSQAAKSDGSDKKALKTTTEESTHEGPALQRVDKHELQADWMIGLLALAVLLGGLIRMNWYRYLKEVFLSLLYPSFSEKIEGNNASNALPSFLMNVLFYATSSIFIYQTLVLFEKPFAGMEGPIRLPLIAALLIVLLTAKSLVYHLVALIFDVRPATRRYLSYAGIATKAFGVLLLPLIVLLPFVDNTLQIYLIKGGIGLFSALYLLQLSHSIRTNFRSLVSGYYIILYLCSLEILPLALLFKVLFK